MVTYNTSDKKYLLPKQESLEQDPKEKAIEKRETYKKANKFCKGLIAFSLTFSLASGIGFVYNMKNAFNIRPKIASEYLNNMKMIFSLENLKQKNKNNKSDIIMYSNAIENYEKRNKEIEEKNKNFKKYGNYVDNTANSFDLFMLGLLGASGGWLGKTIVSRKKKKLEEEFLSKEVEREKEIEEIRKKQDAHVKKLDNLYFELPKK